MFNQHWFTYIFVVLFIAAFFGLFIYARLSKFSNMLYNICLIFLWGFLIIWNWI